MEFVMNSLRFGRHSWLSSGVRQLDMRSRIFSVLLLGLALVASGCRNTVRAADSPSGVSIALTNSLSDTNVLAFFVGTWHWRDERQLIELSRDWRWRWWNLQDQSGDHQNHQS